QIIFQKEQFSHDSLSFLRFVCPTGLKALYVFSANITMCEIEIVSCRVLSISPNITALLQ
ncbi:hypothetical protein, partial [Serratia marcescens]|uniref:hypothetical protein n=1 Tax=Serratia marcescens TaxID=615 RepID=UPI001C9BE4C6